MDLSKRNSGSRRGGKVQSSATSDSLPPTRHSLATTLATVEHWAAPELFGPDAWTRLEALAALLPASLTDRFYLECHLGAVTPRTDLIVGVEEQGRDILAGRNPAIAVEPGPQGVDTWSALRKLCRAWNEGLLPSTSNLSRLWLEFDLEIEKGIPERLPTPRIFVDWQQSVDVTIAAATLEHLLETNESGFFSSLSSDELLHHLRFCLGQLPQPATFFSIGLFPSPEELTVRLCLSLATDALPDYLGAISWPGTVAELRRLPVALQDPDKVLIHLDLGTSVGPQIGFEHRLGNLGRRQIFDNDYLRRLQELGLCTSRKREALGAWPGAGVATLPHELWPSAFVRWLNHLKVTFHPKHGVAAKAYLCHGHAPYVGRRTHDDLTSSLSIE